MFVRRSHSLDDPAEIRRLISENGWALLVAVGERGPIATHLPCVLDPVHDGDGVDDLVLLAHVGRVDPIAAHLKDPRGDVLVVFEGASGYISPSWYGESPHVGTWNFMAVHASGRPEILAGEEAFEVLRLTQEHFEEGFDPLFDLEPVMDYARRIAPGTVAFRLRVRHLQAKAKLSQDKPHDVQQRVVKALEQRGSERERALAAEMRRVQGRPASRRIEA